MLHPLMPTETTESTAPNKATQVTTTMWFFPDEPWPWPYRSGPSPAGPGPGPQRSGSTGSGPVLARADPGP
jgi:hypothetical protein